MFIRNKDKHMSSPLYSTRILLNIITCTKQNRLKVGNRVSYKQSDFKAMFTSENFKC